MNGHADSFPTSPVAVRVLPHAQGLDLPLYATALAAGCDLAAAVASDAPVTLPPGGRALVPTGLVMALQPRFEAQVRPRSGLALRHGITVLNAPGTIDADFRGEIHVLLANFGAEPFSVARGMRIAQLVLAPVTRAVFLPTERLDETARAAGGFGSTGSATSSGG